MPNLKRPLQTLVKNVQALKKQKLSNMSSGLLSGMSEESEIVNSDDSPDMFSDCSPMEEDGLTDVIVHTESDALCNENHGKQSKTENEIVWLGATLEEIRNGSGPTLPHVQSSHSHTVFFQLPLVPNGKPPKPHPQNVRDCWDSDHVRMPCSEHNLYPVQEERDHCCLRQRWELVQEALLKTIVSSQQLEAAILSYNSKYVERWDFTTLHLLFTEIFSEEETDNFFSTLLPKIIQLALQLPTLLTAPIPLLVQHRNHTLSFSQLQIASLLANAFLCTFPRRNTSKRQSEYAHYPDINFNRLFQGQDFSLVKLEKLKCLFHYFRRVCTNAPDGVVTYTRRYISRNNLPQWDRSQRTLTKLHITSEGTIEKDGIGMLQVDFANKLVGGGVLGRGCVQEEIRFVICPELIVARLFTEALDSTEALLIVGCEQFSSYEGYSDKFEWSGDHQDTTLRDSSSRRICSVVAIDAMKLGNRNVQFTPNNLMRELNKAYAGFYCPEFQSNEKLAGVASGNWGCGAFRGDAKLKSLLQLMAASQAGRNLAYFTFGDTHLRDEVFHLYTYLTDQQVTVGLLWRLLCQYYDHSFRGGKLVTELYPFLYQTLSKKKSPLSTTIRTRPSVLGRPRSEGEQSEWLCSRSRGQLNQKELEDALATLPVKECNENRKESEIESQTTGNKQKDNETVVDTAESGMTEPDFTSEDQSKCELGNESESLKSLEGSPEPVGGKTKVTNEKKRVSLMDYLEQYDRNCQSTGSSLVSSTSPTPKRKISDYFTSVPRTK